MMDRTQNTAKMSYIKLQHFSQQHHHEEKRENYRLLFEEHMETWVNSHDCYHFLRTANHDEIRLIWSNEASGFRHLYLMRFLVDHVTDDGHVTKEVRQLTEGNWVVLDEGL